ncbi:MAG: hypothetical protein KAS38_11545, partial [Anaerolineales bacterium]|nr:hypothetical protein [Anaerolineales bacterium]
FRNLIEIGFGVLYLIGAIFNSVYTLRHGDEFYGGFADKAILAPAKYLIQKVVIPHARLITISLIVFQLTVAFCILSRGALVRPGLIAGAIFSFAVVFVSNASGAIASLVMSIVQLYLALTR